MILLFIRDSCITQVKSRALRRGFSTSVPFICYRSWKCAKVLEPNPVDYIVHACELSLCRYMDTCIVCPE